MTALFIKICWIAALFGYGTLGIWAWRRHQRALRAKRELDIGWRKK